MDGFKVHKEFHEILSRIYGSKICFPGNVPKILSGILALGELKINHSYQGSRLFYFARKLTTSVFIIAIRLFGKNWKKVTQHVGTRISAQVRSHAQKVLKDYSPNSQVNMDDSKSEMSEQPDNESLTNPKEHTTRTDEPIYGINRLTMGAGPASNDDNELMANLNQGRKRYRATAENSIDLRPKY